MVEMALFVLKTLKPYQLHAVSDGTRIGMMTRSGEVVKVEVVVGEEDETWSSSLAVMVALLYGGRWSPAYPSFHVVTSLVACIAGETDIHV